MAKQLYILDIELSHITAFEQTANGVEFNPKEQDVHIHDIKIKPGVSLRKFIGRAYYDGDPKTIMENAITLINRDLNYITPNPNEGVIKNPVEYATTAAKKTNTEVDGFDEEQPTPTQETHKQTTPAYGTNPPAQRTHTAQGQEQPKTQGQEQPKTQVQEKPKGTEDGLDIDDDDEKLNEAINNNEDSFDDTKINNDRNLSFMITSRRLKFSKVIELDIKEDKSFSFQIAPEDVKNFVNYIESKKIKIFINGVELTPKDEIDFLKVVFPYIDIKLEL